MGIIVLSHGSREPETIKTMETMIEKVKAKTQNDKIKTAYFQFVKPSLEDSVCSLIDEGVYDICIIPYFLFSGIHIREDIPKAISKVILDHPEVKIKIGETLGEDDRLADIVTERIREIQT